MATNHQFELHAKTAEEIGLDLEKCTFRNFGSSVTLTLTEIEVTPVRMRGRVYPHTKLDGNWKKLFVDIRTYVRTDGRTHLT